MFHLLKCQNYNFLIKTNFSHQSYRRSITAINFPGYLHMTLKANSRFPLNNLSCLFFEMLSFFLDQRNVTKLLQRGTIKANLIYHPDATSLALVRTGQKRRWCFGIPVVIIDLYTKQDHHLGPHRVRPLVEYFLMTTQELKSRLNVCQYYLGSSRKVFH